tara:strand:- start:564 stop:776 length:213 start_codon:yes stop_codon:yes gene_type:complete
MKMVQEPRLEQEIKTQLQLEAHEKECAMFRELVHGKLDSLDKRMWRLEAMIMGSTILVVAMVVSVFMGIR